MAVGLGIASLLVGLGSSYQSFQEGEQTKSNTEDRAAQAETAAQEEADAAIAAEETALLEADEEKRKRAAELEAGSKSTLTTGALGVTDPATVGKKTLLGG